MHIAILTFQAFNELDSLVALGVLNRIRKPDWRVTICCPEPEVTSMNGVTVRAQSMLEDAASADAVIVGSGMRTREIVANPALMQRLRLDPSHQLVAAQCSGTLILARLGLVNNVPACTDLTTKPWVEEAGVEVLNQPFFARGNIATAGGCLASPYLAAWIIARAEGLEAAASALHYVAPVGEKEAFVANALKNIEPYLPHDTMPARDAPYHAHIYFDAGTRANAESFHASLSRAQDVLFVGDLRHRPVGPHPKPQFEFHFRAGALPEMLAMIRSTGLGALVHPLTEDDLADHTSLATWIGEPLVLDLSVLDPPGLNQGVARFGKSDF